MAAGCAASVNGVAHSGLASCTVDGQKPALVVGDALLLAVVVAAAAAALADTAAAPYARWCPASNDDKEEFAPVLGGG